MKMIKCDMCNAIVSNEKSYEAYTVEVKDAYDKNSVLDKHICSTCWENIRGQWSKTTDWFPDVIINLSDEYEDNQDE